MALSLSATTRGALWMTGAATFFSALAAAVRYLSPAIPATEMVFFRALVAAVLLVPWLARHGAAGLGSRRLPLMGLRAALTAIGGLIWFYALGVIRLADAVALHFTLPLFGMVFAVVVLRERIGRHRWTATAIGFAGTLVILRPGLAEVNVVSLLVLFSAACYAAASILSKILVRTESAAMIVFYQNLFTVGLFAVPTPFVWVTPDAFQLALLLALGAANMVAQICIQRAFAAADASAVLPFDFLRLPLTAAAGFVMFAEIPDLWTGVGAVIIFGAAYYVAWRERRRPRAEPLSRR